MTHIFGWYDELKPSVGMESIVYWNHAVNELIPGADPNDPNLYTLKRYLTALGNLPKNGGKFWVQLPYFQVYPDSKGNETVIFEDYAYEIINHCAFDDRFVGFYLADEPEVWGSQWSSHKLKFDQAAAMRVYKHIKSTNSEKLALMVFCDTVLMNRLFLPKNMVLMTDVLGFDFYPFNTQENVDKRGLGYVIKTQSEYNHIIGQIKDIVKTLKRYNVTINRLMYVGQGTGEKDWKGRPTFGQRDATSAELRLVYNAFLMEGIEFKRYFFWSKTYSNDFVWNQVWQHINNVSTEQMPPKDPHKLSLFQRIINFLKNLL